jgi:hypothetical protein
MTSAAELYAELKADVVAVADPLFEHCRQGLRARGAFLPHAAVLNAEGRVTLMGAMTGTKDGFANSAQVVAMLHGGIRQLSREKVLVAVAVAENYAGMRANQPIQAVKVMLEHERGLAVAMFLPFQKTEYGVYHFGESFVVPAPPALKLWPSVSEMR